MTTKLKVLIGLMAASLAGGAGGAFALTRDQASKTGTAGAFDQAIYLYWGHEASSVSLADMTTLVAGTPQYRYLTVSPQSSKTVAGNVRLTFTLAKGAENHIEGLTVAVYKTASLATDETVAGLISEVSPEPTLDKNTLSGTTQFAITTSANVHETVAYYAIKVTWTGANDSSHPAYPLGGSLSIAQSFIAS